MNDGIRPFAVARGLAIVIVAVAAVIVGNHLTRGRHRSTPPAAAEPGPPAPSEPRTRVSPRPSTPPPRFVTTVAPIDQRPRLPPMNQRAMKETIKRGLPRRLSIELEAANQAADAVRLSAAERTGVVAVVREFQERRAQIVESAPDLATTSESVIALRREMDERVSALLGDDRGRRFLDAEVAASNRLRAKPSEPGAGGIPSFP